MATGENGHWPDSVTGKWASRSFALLWAGLLGLNAMLLNQLLYQQQEPLFDATSYLERMHRVMCLTRRDGFNAGWHEATHHTTVTLPYLAVLPLASWLRPARWIGVALQTAGLAVFLLVFDRVLGCCGAKRSGARVLGLVSVGLLAALQFPNGGLSDFRMDLALMLGYGATVGSLAVSLRSGRKADWVVTGLCAAACALVRATAPVYLLFAAAPVWLGHLCFADRKRRHAILGGGVIAAGVAGLAAGWFYLLNAEYLRFYYGVWNTDANARLPWIEALGHLKLCWRQLGWAWLGCVVVAGALASHWGQGPFRFLAQGKRRTAGTGEGQPRDWIPEFVWFAALPAGLLVGMRAGLNPFVSMPSAVAVAMVTGIIFARLHSRLERTAQRVLVVVVLVFVGAAVGKGWAKHAKPNHRQMPEHRALIVAMLDDARRRELDHIRFASLQTCDLQTESLWNCFLFDIPEATFSGNEIFVGGIRVEPDRLFFRPAKADWMAVPGVDDDSRRQWLVGQARERIDYLIVPETEAVASIEASAGKDVVNRHVGPIGELIRASGHWTPVTQFRCGDNGRRYGLYRRL